MKISSLLPGLLWTVPLGRGFGLSLAAHWSFFIPLGCQFVEGWRHRGWAEGCSIVGLSLVCFACVLLHELGHVAAARLLGIRTSAILLLPIGAAALLERIPRAPWREIFIVLAGPAVNFALALIFQVLLAGIDSSPLRYGHWEWLLIIRFLVRLNLFLGCFNLLPVFPMDGGRVLRALLALHWPHGWATGWAVVTGRILAVVGGLYIALAEHSLQGVGLLIFVVVAGEFELREVRTRMDFLWPSPFPTRRTLAVANPGAARLHPAKGTPRFWQPAKAYPITSF